MKREVLKRRSLLLLAIAVVLFVVAIIAHYAQASPHGESGGATNPAPQAPHPQDVAVSAVVEIAGAISGLLTACASLITAVVALRTSRERANPAGGAPAGGSTESSSGDG